MTQCKSLLGLSILFLGLDQQYHNLDFALLFHDHNKKGLALLKLAIHDCDKLYSLQESHREHSTAGKPVNNRYDKIGKGIHTESLWFDGLMVALHSVQLEAGMTQSL
jgi:hypothetical protein